MSIPAGFVQIELFSSEPAKKKKTAKKAKEAVDDDYETNKNPMVRKYGDVWNRAKCGGTSRTKPCVHFDTQRNRCQLRRGKHNAKWDACGKYEPMKEAKA